jgi:hypothetical protein
MKRSIEELEKLIQTTLEENFNGFERGEDGTWRARNGSTDVRLWLTDDGSRIRFFGPVAYEVPVSGELCWHILQHNVGTLVPLALLTSDDDRDRATVAFDYVRTTEGLDPDEIRLLVAVAAVDADHDDEDFVARFGGKLNYE